MAETEEKRNENEKSRDRSQNEGCRTGFPDWIWMFAELGGYRELLWQMLIRDLKLRYKQAIMGFFWAIFVPMMVVVSGSVLKYVMATVSGQPLEMISFTNMAVKAIGWSLFVGILNGGATSLISNINLITKIYFPREVLPISALLTQCFDSMVGAAALLVLLIFTHSIVWSWALLWVPVLTFLLICLALGISLFLSCSMVFYRDVKYLLSVFTSFGMFFSPVFYETNQLGGRLAELMMLNPVAPLLEGIRLSVVRGESLLRPIHDAAGTLVWHPAFLIYAVCFSIFGLIFAWRFFHVKERTYAEFI